MKGNAQEWTLLPLRYTRHIKAENGQPGGKNQLTGRFGEDVYIEVPVGTVARNENGEILGEILEHGQEIILMKGGKGGLGNEHFKSATNQTPRYAQPGLPGEEGYIIFELKVLADVGLVGFPNAGKSFVMADIPGIIEGAAEGRGLGHRFLRHIERNSILLFLIPADSKNHYEEFKILENELKEYNPELLDKDFIVSISKSDLLDNELKAEISAEFPEKYKPLFFSGVTQEGLMELKDVIWKHLHG